VEEGLSIVSASTTAELAQSTHISYDIDKRDDDGRGLRIRSMEPA